VLCTNAFLNHMHAGHAYIPALAFLTLGIWILPGSGSTLTAWAAGAALATSALLWFPFVLVIPAALLAGVFATGKPTRNRMRLIALATLACACIGLAGYMLGAVEVHATTPGLLKAWFQSSSHGIHQNRNLLRTLFGLPRSFIFMADDGLRLKRYLFHDPYAHVTLAELVRFSLVNFGLFYIFVLVLLVSLSRMRASRGAVVCLLAAAFPVLAFSILLFEGGATERYLPLTPFVCLALATFFATPQRPRGAFFAVAAFLVIALVTNLHAMFYTTVDAEAESMAVRVRLLKPVLNVESQVALISLRDPLAAFGENFPFNPLNRPAPLKVLAITEVGGTYASDWASEFAVQALAIWGQSGDFWITKRVFASRPEQEWGWVEGDNPELPWAKVVDFFRNFETGEGIGGADGFVRLPPSDHNRQFLLLSDELSRQTRRKGILN
jgi:hypothetical protein